MADFTADCLLQVLSGWPVPSRYRVALSGGLDSMVLLHAMASLRDRLPAALTAVHVNHGLHPDAGDWAQHCAAVCQRLGVPLEVLELALDIPRGQSLEAVAREARYEALAGGMAPDELLLTAQHQDDQAETVLLQLLRGSGVAGLAAMPALSSLAAGRLGRPLLELRRADLAAYAGRYGLQWIDDPSNDDTRFDRNYLRQEIMPRLQARWPGLTTTLARSAAHCAAAEQVLTDVAATDLAPCLLSPFQLAVYPLLQLAPERRAPLIRLWIARAGLPLPPAHKLAQLWDEVIGAREDAAPLLSWPGAELRRYRDSLWLMPALEPVAPAWQAAWSGEAALPLPHGLGELHAQAAGWGIAREHWKQGHKTVAFRREGIHCTPAGRRGSRSLKKLFQELDVPPWLRLRVPLLFIDGELAAVGDLCVCEPFAGDAHGVRLRWQRAPWLQLPDPEAGDEEE